MKPGNQTDLRLYLESEYRIIVTKQAISKLVKEKDYRLRFTPGGKILIEETAKILSDSGFGERAAVVRRNNGNKDVDILTAKESDIPTSKEVEESPLKETDDYNKINRYLAFQKYEKERIANEKSKKELVLFSEVSDKLFTVLREIRDDLQALPKKVGPLARLSPTNHESIQLTQKEVDRILLSRIGGEYIFDDQLKKKTSEILTS
jgi:hypothetical protein